VVVSVGGPGPKRGGTSAWEIHAWETNQSGPFSPPHPPSLTPSPSMCYLGLIRHVQNLYSYAGQILGGRRQRKWDNAVGNCCCCYYYYFFFFYGCCCFWCCMTACIVTFVCTPNHYTYKYKIINFLICLDITKFLHSWWRQTEVPAKCRFWRHMITKAVFFSRHFRAICLMSTPGFTEKEINDNTLIWLWD